MTIGIPQNNPDNLSIKEWVAKNTLPGVGSAQEEVVISEIRSIKVSTPVSRQGITIYMP